MRYGIFSDIHGNLQALESVTEALKKEKVDYYLCAGDVVGYGANPHECIRIIKDIKAICVAGNHDWATLSKTSIQYFNPLAKEAVFWTRRSTSDKDKEFLEKLSLIHRGRDFILVHGTLNEPEHFDYLMDRYQAKATFNLMDKDICFIGHSHVVGVFVQRNKAIGYSSLVDLKLEKSCRYIVNVGSVGQPRDGNPMASYCVFDTDKKMISVKRINYNVEEAQKRIIESGLPPFLASRLAFGN